MPSAFECSSRDPRKPRRVIRLLSRLAMVLAWMWGGALCASAAAGADATDRLWYGTNASGEPTIHLYFFWTETCPHCQRARPFVDNLAADLGWVDVRSVPLSEGRPEDIALFLKMTEALGTRASGVPAFLFCEQMIVGFAAAETTGADLRRALILCHDRVTGSASILPPLAASTPIELPLFGLIDPQTSSLPLLTVMIAAVDAFNPCAFFVLMFLMSLLAHARKRRRMAVIGGLFVTTSGLLYFAFMAAWLNVFLFIGELRWVTVIAALIALGLAAINIKDYFWLGRGVSLSIPDTAKPGLFARMRALTLADQWPVLVLGTMTLAVAANTYELLCTAGFPMLFTRLLTLHDLSTSSYYLYLALYNVVYVIPLLGIATAFVITIGSRKLQEREGRTLKLVSGLMMLGLAAALLLAPDRLTDIRVAAGLILMAVIVTAVIAVLFPRRSAT